MLRMIVNSTQPKAVFRSRMLLVKAHPGACSPAPPGISIGCASRSTLTSPLAAVPRGRVAESMHCVYLFGTWFCGTGDETFRFLTRAADDPTRDRDSPVSLSSSEYDPGANHGRAYCGESARSRWRTAKRLTSKDIATAQALYDGGKTTVQEICRLFKISKTTFYQYVRPQIEL